MYTLECPYCEEDFEIDEFDESGFEEECPHCEEKFKVEVELEPVFRESQFNYVDCEECGNKFDKDYLSMSPMPGKYHSQSSICKDCRYKLTIEEYKNGS